MPLTWKSHLNDDGSVRSLTTRLGHVSVSVRVRVVPHGMPRAGTPCGFECVIHPETINLAQAETLEGVRQAGEVKLRQMARDLTRDAISAWRPHKVR